VLLLAQEHGRLLLMVQFIYGLSRPSRKRRLTVRDNINVRSDDDVRYWAQCLGVNERTLTAAVKSVGPSVDKVREHLSGLDNTDSGLTLDDGPPAVTKTEDSQEPQGQGENA
jgi:hypothetical protein